MSHVRLPQKVSSCVLGRSDSSRTNSYAAGSELPAALLEDLFEQPGICLEIMVVI
jgi:hypothetical protein